jgi:hypothetical protein
MKLSQAQITKVKNVKKVEEAGNLGRKGLGELSLSKWCLVKGLVPDDHVPRQ